MKYILDSYDWYNENNSNENQLSHLKKEEEKENISLSEWIRQSIDELWFQN